MVGGRLKIPSQEKEVLDHLKKYGSITSLEAINEYGCTRLGSRIFDLRQSGYPIKTVMVTVKNRKGRKVTVARYVLEQKGET